MKKHIYVMISVVLWGITQFLMDRLNQVFTPPLLNFLRFFFSGMLLLIPIKDNREPFLWKYIITGGLGAFGYYILISYALNISSVSFVAVMGGSLPVLALIIDKVFGKQRIQSIKLISAGVSVLGVFWFSNDANIKGNMMAGSLMILANTSWLLYCHLKKKWNIEENNQILGYEFISSSFLTLPLCFSFTIIKPMNMGNYLDFFAIVLLATIIPYCLYLKGSTGLSLNTGALYMNLLPITSLIPVFITGGLMLSAIQIVGIVLLIVSAVISPVSLWFNKKLHSYKNNFL